MIDAILQARVSATRLPGKVLMPVLGRPILSYNIERIRRAKTVKRVIVATTENREDDAIQRLCESESVPVFRGSEADVLDRIYRCMKLFGMERCAKLTADNPLVDPAVIDQVIGFDLARAGDYDYVSNNHPPTWQDGQEVEVFNASALEAAWLEATQPFQREHVTPFIWDQPERFRLGNVARAEDRWYRDYRWTLDYPEDYAFVKAVFETLYPARPDFGTEDVMELLRRQPEIHALNASRAGYVWYREHLDSLRSVAGGGHLKQG
jgi:spore coat polysaccharide biosynthesis protein SpsF